MNTIYYCNQNPNIICEAASLGSPNYNCNICEHQKVEMPKLLKMPKITDENGNAKKYLLQVNTDSGSIYTELLFENEIINKIDMQDCSYEELAIFDVSEFGTITPLTIKGTWHNINDPLRIEICKEDGTKVFAGYGTDH